MRRRDCMTTINSIIKATANLKRRIKGALLPEVDDPKLEAEVLDAARHVATAESALRGIAEKLGAQSGNGKPPAKTPKPRTSKKASGPLPDFIGDATPVTQHGESGNDA